MATYLVRLLICIGLMLSGLLLYRLDALPNRPFTWLNYAPVHVSPPALDIGPAAPTSGKLLTIKGSGFAPRQPVQLSLNRHRLTKVYTNTDGEFVVAVDRSMIRSDHNEITAVALPSPQVTPTRGVQIAQAQWSEDAGVTSVSD